MMLVTGALPQPDPLPASLLRQNPAQNLSGLKRSPGCSPRPALHPAQIDQADLNRRLASGVMQGPSSFINYARSNLQEGRAKNLFSPFAPDILMLHCAVAGDSTNSDREMVCVVSIARLCRPKQTSREPDSQGVRLTRTLSSGASGGDNHCRVRRPNGS